MADNPIIGGVYLKTWQSGDSMAIVREVIETNFEELERRINSISKINKRSGFGLFGKKKREREQEFKNFFDWLEDIEKTNYQSIDAIKNNLTTKLKWVVEHDKSKDRYIEAMDSQQRTIEVLTNALCDKYKDGLFIYSEDGKIPTVIRNGKELTDDLTQEFSINWCIGEFPYIKQIAGAHKDMDV